MGYTFCKLILIDGLKCFIFCLKAFVSLSGICSAGVIDFKKSTTPLSYWTPLARELTRTNDVPWMKPLSLLKHCFLLGLWVSQCIASFYWLSSPFNLNEFHLEKSVKKKRSGRGLFIEKHAWHWAFQASVWPHRLVRNLRIPQRSKPQNAFKTLYYQYTVFMLHLILPWFTLPACRRMKRKQTLGGSRCIIESEVLRHSWWGDEREQTSVVCHWLHSMESSWTLYYWDSLPLSGTWIALQ